MLRRADGALRRKDRSLGAVMLAHVPAEDEGFGEERCTDRGNANGCAVQIGRDRGGAPGPLGRLCARPRRGRGRPATGAGARLTRDGFGTNLTTKLPNYDKDIWAGRGTIELHGDDFFARIAADYTHDASHARGGHRFIPGMVSGTPVLADVYDTQGGLNTPKQDVKAWGVSMFFEAKPSDALTLRSISAYRKDDSLTPIDFDEESLAFGAHVEVGHGGHFLGAEHTMERFRTCFYRPFLSSSDNYERWMRNGGHDTAARAGEIWKQKLEAYEAPAIDDAVKAELEEFVTRRRAELGD